MVALIGSESAPTSPVRLYQRTRTVAVLPTSSALNDNSNSGRVISPWKVSAPTSSGTGVPAGATNVKTSAPWQPAGRARRVGVVSSTMRRDSVRGLVVAFFDSWGRVEGGGVGVRTES